MDFLWKGFFFQDIFWKRLPIVSCSLHFKTTMLWWFFKLHYYYSNFGVSRLKRNSPVRASNFFVFHVEPFYRSLPCSCGSETFFSGTCEAVKNGTEVNTETETESGAIPARNASKSKCNPPFFSKFKIFLWKGLHVCCIFRKHFREFHRFPLISKWKFVNTVCFMMMMMRLLTIFEFLHFR